jgi:hypothetical protein
MKKLLIVLLAVALASGASAQRGHGYSHGGGYTRSHVIVGVGAYAPFYPYYGLGFGYPFYPYGPTYGYGHRPSKLDLQIEDIKNDYADKIWSVKEDKSLPRKQRREKVHELKRERDQEIIDTKRNYYKY